MASKNFESPTDPLWYKDAVFYEVRIRSFCDSDADGIGDLNGLTLKLDYLRDLGVTTLWLLPFYPSPLRDDGYDISNYVDIHPELGTLDDFKIFLAEAHQRGLKIVTELVLNHTSDQHPWFQRARRAAAGSPERDYYVWSDTPDKFREARIIFKDFESSNWTWDPVAKSYYWHRFYGHQPDLNFDNPLVKKDLFSVVDFWLDLGVDGLRLDAVPYLFEREGTNCENLPETHQFLRELRQHVDRKFQNRMLLAEANQWPEDAAPYLGDECHMAFHFPIMPRMFMAIHMEDRFPIIDILSQTPPIPEASQWALFLRNHDELTLEMVTDEERDYMNRVYASDLQARVNLGIRRRLAPLMGNHRRKIELMNGLLFSLPGTPVIYYGDEIGMGDNIYLGDRNGVRTPMQWSADKNAGYSRANPQRLYLPVIIDPEYHYEACNVETQENNTHSLLWWTKRLIAHRKSHKAFGRGTIEFLFPSNNKILAFTRRFGEEIVLVVANLSRFVQFAELDMVLFKNMTPIELFGRVEFPPIGDLPYFLTMGPHTFYWFLLEPKRNHLEAERRMQTTLSMIEVMKDWKHLLGSEKSHLEEVLPSYLKRCRWFGGKAHAIRNVRVFEAVPVGKADPQAFLTMLRVEYLDTGPELYQLPLTAAFGDRMKEIERDYPHAVVASIKIYPDETPGILFDALVDKKFCSDLLEGVVGAVLWKGEKGYVQALPAAALPTPEAVGLLEPNTGKAEQSNSSILYGGKFIMKIYRKLEEGINPDYELSRFLTEKVHFTHTPQLAGAFRYRQTRDTSMILALLQGFVPNEGDAWRYTLDELARFYERALSGPAAVPPAKDPIQLLNEDIPAADIGILGSYVESARLLGARTAELHRALSSDQDDPEFRPEPFSPFHQKSLYQSFRGLTTRVFQMLGRNLRDLPEDIRAEADKVLHLQNKALVFFQGIKQVKITAAQIRCHGDFHLGQVLYTGSDFVILDFEGEPARPLSERRLKRSAFKDVAGMIRSFHYATYVAIEEQRARGLVPEGRLGEVEWWGQFWFSWIGSTYLRSYLTHSEGAPYIPSSRETMEFLLRAFILEKAIYELGYELNNRPDWVRIPLRGIAQLLGA